MALEKGTEEWMFWSDFFQFCKKYWEIPESEEYWDKLAKEANELYDKYETNYANKFIISFLELKNEEYKNMNK